MTTDLAELLADERDGLICALTRYGEPQRTVAREADVDQATVSRLVAKRRHAAAIGSREDGLRRLRGAADRLAACTRRRDELIGELVRLGASQRAVAACARVHQSTVSRLVARRRCPA
ncbi:hypothetical protein M8542_09835 [Amycolatopsis sp. OK19-0408]|uniref:Uncharacterized protein n=1 Tax=Amycolatopsis iheyensis TaxID=2945988 RepID=A0A9X2N884_9PSEU|nr:hypothetical protein [Amycolatopsis iheyensis]MCR6483117.1 hypothetical protein [Amycolatopsis iheyensis]